MKSLTQSLQKIKAYIPADKFYRVELSTMSLPRGAGWQDGGLCPFHADKQPGSFKLNVKTGAFKCFSCETKSGDIIAFIRKRDSLSNKRKIYLI